MRIAPVDIEALTAPEPLVSLSEVKVPLRVEHTFEDALIGTYLAAASAHLDGPQGITGRAMGGGTYLMHYEGAFSGCALAAGLCGTVASVDEINGEAPDPIPAVLRSFGEPYLAANSSWLDSAGRCTVQLTFAVSVLPHAKAAAMALVGQMYRYREDTVDSAAENPAVRRAITALKTRFVA